MKRFLIISFTAVYAILSMGFSLRVHNCLGAQDSSCCMSTCCGDEGQEEDPGCAFPADAEIPCCDDEVFIVQFQSEPYLTSQVLQEVQDDALIVTQRLHNQHGGESERCTDFLSAVGFISDSSPPLWLLYSNFTFYG